MKPAFDEHARSVNKPFPLEKADGLRRAENAHGGDALAHPKAIEY